jgi:hypothetical protein
VTALCCIVCRCPCRHQRACSVHGFLFACGRTSLHTCVQLADVCLHLLPLQVCCTSLAAARSPTLWCQLSRCATTHSPTAPAAACCKQVC